MDPSEIRGERISSRTSTERFFIRRSEYPMNVMSALLKIAFIWFVVGVIESQRKWLKNNGDKLASPC